MRVGGDADLMIFPSSEEELRRVLRTLTDERLPYFILGGGTNLIVADKGIREPVIATEKLKRIAVDGCRITAEAGAQVEDVCLAALNAESAATMDEVFSRADIVSLHLALNDATRGIIGPAQLDLMRPGTLLVNTARAELIEPGAMLRRLSRGDIAAAIDVTAPEPLPDDDPLRTLPNLILTPHVAWRSDRALAALVEQNVRSAVEFLKGGAYNVIV